MPGSFRNYGKIDPYVQFQHDNKKKARRRTIIIVATSLFLVVAAVCLIAGIAVSRKRSSSDSSSDSDAQFKSGSKAIQIACNTTLYPDTCRQSLSSDPGSLSADPVELVAIAVKLALSEVNNAYTLAMNMAAETDLSDLEIMAAQDCSELMDNTMDYLNGSISELKSLDLTAIGTSLAEVKVWLSTALSDQTACSDGFSNLTGSAQQIMDSKQEYVSELIINGLCLVGTLSELGSDLSSWKKALPLIPDIFHLRRLLSADDNSVGFDDIGASSSSASSFPSYVTGFPDWVSAGDRKLLQAPAPSVSVSYNLVVAWDGTGDYTTIKQALSNVPEKRDGRYVIYIKAGTYTEVFNVTKDLVNITLIGDGCNKTVITGDRNVAILQYTTFRSATVGIAAKGFIAKDITFRNTAGPSGHQAVAVRAGADLVVFDSCCFEGYQDTLYALSGRQFYSNCKIYGTVDFIFGNAIAIFQGCELYARQPLQGQQNTYTAQGRKVSVDVSGYSFLGCTLSAASDLQSSTFNVSTYLGRPWKDYSRTVYLQSTIGGHVDPTGWLPWNASNPFENTVYYGEYENTGPGSNVDQRVSWKGVHPRMSLDDASEYTVEAFISGERWLPDTVTYQSGL